MVLWCLMPLSHFTAILTCAAYFIIALEKKMATGQGGILSALLLFAILFRLGLLQEPIYDAEYRRVNDLSFYACNAHHISKFDYVLSGLTVSTSENGSKV
jgi:hypothetical protein